MLDQKTQDEVQEMRKLGVPLSVIAKTLNIPLSSIHNLQYEKANNNA
ncbi:hypothetical protein [Cysteiniphilum sp. 6C5]